MKIELIQQQGLILLLFSVNVLGTLNVHASSKANQAIIESATCEVYRELMAMSLPSDVTQVYNYSLSEAQLLADERKHREGLRLLLQTDQSQPLSRAYSEYYLAQMYIDDESQNVRRKQLLTRAIESEKLKGLELVDALKSLYTLHKEAGEYATASSYHQTWQRLHCRSAVELNIEEAALPSVTQAASVQLNKQASELAALSTSMSVLSTTQQSSPHGVNLQTNVAVTNAVERNKLSSERTEPERLLEYLEPTYPEQAFANDIEGFVSLSVTITKDGFVTNLDVLKSEPNGVFDKSVIEAVKQWRYQPKRLNGRNVEKTNHKMRLIFEIEHPQQ